MYLDISRLITALASMVMTIGLYLQVIKIWRSKSAKDFSPGLLFALILNEAAWLNYGVALSEWPIILIGILNMPAVIMAIIGYRRWGTRSSASEDAG